MNLPEWSAILTTYNAEGTISDALAGILTQSIPPTEILIIDDASADSTQDIIAHWAQRESRIVPIFLPRNSGTASIPRNQGIARMRTAFGIIFDDDDLSLPERARAHLQRLTRGYDFSYVGSKKINRESGEIEIAASAFNLHPSNLDDLKLQVLLGIRDCKTPRIIVPASVLGFSKEAVKELNGFNESLTRCEDIDLTIRALNHGFRIVGDREILVHRLITERDYKSKSSDIEAERVLQRQHGKDWNLRMKVASYLHYQSRQQFSKAAYWNACIWSVPLFVIAPRLLIGSVLRLLSQLNRKFKFRKSRK